MHVAAAVLATALVVLLVVVQPSLGRRRYLALVDRLRVDPTARVRFYRRAVVSEWLLVGVVAVIGLLAGRTPREIGLTSAHASSTAAGLALACTVGAVVGVAASTVAIRRSGSATIDALRRQARGFAELLPRTPRERRTFVVVALTAGICEEILYRGFGIAYVRWLLPGATSLVVILLTGAAFGVAHAYQGPRNVLVTGLLGVVLAWITIATGTLLPAMVVHSAVDLRVVFLPAGVARADALGLPESPADEPPADAPPVDEPQR